jgi:hypothetical protein
MGVAVGNVLEARLIFDIPDDVAVNVLHYQVTAILGASKTEVEIANDLLVRVGAAYAGLMSVNTQLRGITVQKILPLPAGAPGFSTGAAFAGSQIGDTLPNQVAGIITKRTALAGRANRGRVYIPGAAESANAAGGVPTVGYVNTLLILAPLLLSEWTSGIGLDQATMQPRILHRLLGTVTAVTGSTARPYWTTQRRRNNGQF